MSLSRPLRLSVLVLLLLSALSSALWVTSESPCLSLCSTDAGNTTTDDIVCLDTEFSQTTNGTNFQNCVECELQSTAADPSTGVTDVLWGLYNLRFAFSTCVYGVPTAKTSLSSPCQVTCDPLSQAIEAGLSVNASRSDLSFCNLPNFGDAAIDACAKCYNLLPGQVYMGNFLEALHIACRLPPTPSKPFALPVNTIFNYTLLAGPSQSTAAPTHHVAHLAIIIALPIVFAVLLTIGCCVSCWFCARRRRRLAAERGDMRRVHQSWVDSPNSPSMARLRQNWAETPVSPTVGRHQSWGMSPVSPSVAHQPQSWGTSAVSPSVVRLRQSWSESPTVTRDFSPISPFQWNAPTSMENIYAAGPTLQQSNSYGPHRPYNPQDYELQINPISQQPGNDPASLHDDWFPPQQQESDPASLHDNYFPPPPAAPGMLANIQKQGTVPPPNLMQPVPPSFRRREMEKEDQDNQQNQSMEGSGGELSVENHDFYDHEDDGEEHVQAKRKKKEDGGSILNHAERNEF